MKKLSLSQAWEETRSVLGRDGRLFASVALALVVLPETVAGVLAPATPGGSSAVTLALVAVTIVIGFIAQVSLNRLAIGPSTTVGHAIGRGLLRMPALVGSFVLVIVGLFIVLVPVVLVFGATGLIDSPAAGHEAPASLLLLIVIIAALCYAVFQLMIPVAAAEHGGSLHLLVRSWQLARGAYLRLLAFVALVFFCVLVILIAAEYSLGSVIALAFGPPDAFSLSALLIALLVALLQAVFTVFFAVMLARIYVQLAGGAGAQPSVPRSGT